MANFRSATLPKAVPSDDDEEFDIDALIAELDTDTETMEKSDKLAKKHAKAKEDARDSFFENLTIKARYEEELQSETLTYIVDETGDSIEDVQKLVITQYPEYEIINITRDDEEWTVEVQEDPSKMKLSHINEKLGKVFGRTYALTGASFDSDGLLKNHPDIAALVLRQTNSITVEPGDWDGEGEQTTYYSFVEDAAKKLLKDQPESLPILQRYSSPGRISVRLTPAREVKPDDK